MSEVLLLQNTRIEGPGYLGELKNDGFEIISVNAKHDQLVEKDYSLIVILRASESANDDLPYLKAEQQLIRNYVENPCSGYLFGFSTNC